MSVIIAKNQTVGDLVLTLLSAPDTIIPGSGQVTLTDWNTVTEIQNDPELAAYIAADQVLLEVDGEDQTKEQSLSIAAPIVLPVDDTTELVQDPTDQTKRVRIDAGNIATGTTRVITAPDSDLDLGTVATDTDVSTAVSDHAALTDVHHARDHASTHQDGGIDEVATATPAANAIPKAAADNELAANWLKDFTGDSGSGGIKGAVPAPAAGDAAEGKYLAADGSWSTPPGAGITLAALYEFDSTTLDENPGGGLFRLNNATQSSATFAYYNDTTKDGFDIRNLLLQLGRGDRLYIQEQSSGSRYHFFEITGNPTAAAGYSKIPISNLGSGSDLQNDEKCSSVILASVNTGRRKDYGKLAADPAGSPEDGDIYYNTSTDMEMRYDNTRAKWLSVDSSMFTFSNGGFFGTAPGAYYNGIGNVTGTSSNGYLLGWNATVVGFGYTRSDSDSATFEIMDDGSSALTVASSAGSGKSINLNTDIAADSVLALRNQSGGNTTTGVQAWVKIRWRA